MLSVEACRAAVAPHFRGRRWLIAHDIVNGSIREARELREHFGADAFALGGRWGMGDPDDSVPTACVDLPFAGNMMADIRSGLHALTALPPAMQAEIDRWDPDHEALGLMGFLSDEASVAGRRVYGARRKEWTALEDKTTIDALWDEVGANRAPSRVVSLAGPDLETATRELDWGDGAVWVVDNDQGWHGGAKGLRWIRSTKDIAKARGELLAHGKSARVMPFLEGVPCSVHGMVFPDYVVAGRPCEMLVLRRPDGRLYYARAATFWDPPDADRAAMRELVRRVGVHLRSRVDFRGVFTIDGVMTERGFLPTELNSRYGAALAVVASGIPGLPLRWMDRVLIEGDPLPVDPRAFESWLIDIADTHRAGSVNAVGGGRQFERTEQRVVIGSDAGLVVQQDHPHPLATISVGPGSEGFFLRAVLTPDQVEVGRSTAPLVAEIIAAMSDHLGLGLEPMQPAQEMR